MPVVRDASGRHLAQTGSNFPYAPRATVCQFAASSLSLLSSGVLSWEGSVLLDGVEEDRLLRRRDGEEIENATDSEIDAHQRRDVKEALLAEGGQGLVVERLLDAMLNGQLTHESKDKPCLATELLRRATRGQCVRIAGGNPRGLRQDPVGVDLVVRAPG